MYVYELALTVLPGGDSDTATSCESLTCLSALDVGNVSTRALRLATGDTERTLVDFRKIGDFTRTDPESSEGSCR